VNAAAAVAADPVSVAKVADSEEAEAVIGEAVAAVVALGREQEEGEEVIFVSSLNL
jgi:hypothetical protein